MDQQQAAQDLVKPLEGNRDQNEKRLQEQTTDTTYVQLRDADTKIARLEEQAKAFEFHGYLRSGYGLNGLGGQQVAFQAPGAGAKFRLGAVPLAFAGGRTSEPATVRSYAEPYHTATDSDGRERVVESATKSVYQEFAEGEVLRKWAGIWGILAMMVRIVDRRGGPD